MTMTGCFYDYDGVNQYLYDTEGRICAVASTPIPGITIVTGYLYDADGQRVAKGRISSWSCNPAVNGFQTLSDYILGPGGEQMTEMGIDASAGSSTTNLVWKHTNVWAGGNLIATYDNDGLHFYLNDPLGTCRVQTDYAGVIEQTCQGLPYGDGLNCMSASKGTNGTVYAGSLSGPTEHHYTGKERDSESGNDYFGARYYASSMGRFLSPDPLLNSGRPDNPQSWNRYSYAKNNPLARIDPTGLYDINCAQNDTACQAYHQRFNEAVDKARELLQGMDPKSDQAKGLSKALDALGKDNDGNGVTVSFGPTKTGGAMETNGMHITVDFAGQDAQQKAWRDAGWDVNTTVDDAAGEVHEGTHIEQNKERRGISETEAYTNESWTSEAGRSNNTDGVWNQSWANGPDREILRQQAIKDAAQRSEDATKAAIKREKQNQ